MEKNLPEKDDQPKHDAPSPDSSAAISKPNDDHKSTSAKPEDDHKSTDTKPDHDDPKSTDTKPDHDDPNSTPKADHHNIDDHDHKSTAKPDDHNANVNPSETAVHLHTDGDDPDYEIKKHQDPNENENEIKTENDGQSDPVVVEDPVPEPEPEPEEDPSLEKVSEDLDRCISSLPSEKNENDDGLSFPEELPKLVEKFMNLVEDEVIAKRDSGESKIKWCQVPEEDASFLEALDRIRRLSKYLSFLGLKFEESHGALINRLGSIQHRALLYLEEEFRMLLEESRHCTEPNTPSAGDKDHNSHGNKGGNNNKQQQDQEQDRCMLPDYSESRGGGDQLQADICLGYAQEVVNNLNKIAKEMISGGYETECCEVYTISRRLAFDETLHKLGLEKHSLDDIQKMNWEALEREVVSWIKAFKECAAVYFSGERKLAEVVFADYPSISSSLFSNLTRGVIIRLLNFAEGIVISKRSAEKLFKTLDMYEALREVVPKMDNLFPVECVNELKAETTTVRSRLGEAVIFIFCDLENSIKAETGRNPVPGGAVHPLTRYMMNYLRNTCEYKETLELVFREHSKIERADSTSRPDHDYEAGEGMSSGNANEQSDHQSPFYLQLMRVMDLLDSNLEAKAKLYKDSALSSIFMMNNGRYILQKIKGSTEINSCMGDTWCRKRSSDLRQYHKNYQRETWSRLLQCLGHEGLTVHGKVAKPVLKERFKSFNALFDEIHKTQSTWVVSDEQLQSELRVSISAVVIPAYRSFLGRFSQVLDPGRQTEKYIKFQAEDIETYIDELFDGNPNSSIFKKKP
ncbi:unnamed protein product [Prunus armeniaca]|uniref:Exocyst subunit Exo70 family protein n=1 Tax=Prunus armeniaca TaxID=36596 RepID=A0A6J5UIH6_PRUAR|nr:unnamed protein product [Prunus armeniaca]